jgi:hypothetical protein
MFEVSRACIGYVGRIRSRRLRARAEHLEQATVIAQLHTGRRMHSINFVYMHLEHMPAVLFVSFLPPFWQECFFGFYI